jgi:predicted dehydrogenase
MHLRAAVDAGKHVFCEKPVAVRRAGREEGDGGGKLAAEKKLSVVSGLCYRYERGNVETVKRIHDGQIGDIVSLQTNYTHRGCG